MWKVVDQKSESVELSFQLWARPDVEIVLFLSQQKLRSKLQRSANWAVKTGKCAALLAKNDRIFAHKKPLKLYELQKKVSHVLLSPRIFIFVIRSQDRWKTLITSLFTNKWFHPTGGQKLFIVGLEAHATLSLYSRDEGTSTRISAGEHYGNGVSWPRTR